jgi:proton-translocating NAD(P)+ transhydrogenase subunit alpha
MKIGVPKEMGVGEKRVSIVPESVSKLGVEVIVETGAGSQAGYDDSSYMAAGCKIAADAQSLYAGSELVAKIAPPTPKESSMFMQGSTLISYLYPLNNVESLKQLASKGITAFALDLMPRISRAQSMDTLSSQANLAGYKAALMAADSLPKIFPLMMTAAGTIPPAKILVIGAGVSGLQAIATARRLGALIEAYDVRPAVKEQVESLGAKFVELPIQAADAQTAGGYAKAQSDEFYKKQTELLAQRIALVDGVISTALVPGKKAPVLISENAVKGMRPGSVIVDLAAEQGGNCALTEPGRSVVKYGVTIHGPLNIPSSIAPQASQLFSKNVTTYFLAISKNGALTLDTNDELVKGPMVLNKGEVVYEPLKAAIGGSKQ